MKVIDRVSEYIQQNRMIEKGDRLVVGVSGGADSMCLLFLLCELQKKLDIDITALHIHHGIRGAGADRDAAFVSGYCKNKGIKFILEKIDVPAEAARTHETIEEAARRLRYEVLLTYTRSVGGKIAIAHHREDQAETVLHNLLRGSSLTGLGGIKPVREMAGVLIVRPLLQISRAEIEGLLREAGVAFVTDETNLELQYTRNKIRHGIMPLALEINQGAARHIVQAAGEISEANEIIQKLSRELYLKYVAEESLAAQKVSDQKKIHISAGLLAEEALLQRNVLRLAIEKSAGRLKDITAEHIWALQHLLAESQTGREIELPYELRAQKGYGEIILSRGKRFYPNAEEQYKTSLEIIKTESEDYPKEMYTKWLDCVNIKEILRFRKRQSGDYIVIGAGRQKLQDFFVKQKVPKDERDSVLLLAAEGSSEILWVVSKSISRINERYKVKPGQTEVVEARVEFCD